MNQVRLIFAAAALLIGLSPTFAQIPQFNLPPNTVVGRTANGTGPAQAIPFSSIQASTLPNGSVGNSKLITGAANTVKGSVNGTTTSDLAIASCSALYNFTQWVSGTGWQCGINLVLPSRAVAATLNLSAFTSVATLGYDSPGDGGGATFKNVGSAPFIDSRVIGGNLVGGSGYTNGVTFGNHFTGGTGKDFIAAVSVSGGAVATVNFANSPGTAYTAGDVLTAPIAGGTGFTFTVASVTAPVGSFTDAAGTHFQITPDQGVFPNVRQFGAKLDWDGTDGTATDDFASVQAALRFAAWRGNTSFDSGGWNGGKVLMGQGSSLICGSGTQSLIIPAFVTLEGASAIGTTLKMCNAFNAATHFIEMGDPNWHSECFNVAMKNLTVFANRLVSANASIALVHSNCAGDFAELDHVYMWSGTRMCTFFESGIGTVIFNAGSCAGAGSNILMQFGVVGTPIGTQFIAISNWGFGGPTSGGLQTGAGLVINGGFHTIESVHCEAIPSCITVNIPSTGNGEQVTLRNINAGNIPGGTSCAANIILTSANLPGNTFISKVPAGSCPIVVQDLQAGTPGNRTTTIGLEIQFNP